MASGEYTSDSVPGYSVKTLCKPCSEDGNNIEAVKFCENCDTYFCKPCVGLHNKVLKSHRVLDKAAIKSKGDQKAKSKSTSKLLTDECEYHPGNVIQMYCGDHDVVCCTVCIALEHRACKGVDFIPKAAATFFKEQDKNETKISLDALCSDIEDFKTVKSKELLDFNNSERYILAEIQTTKERLVARVCELERRSIADVQEAFKGKTHIVKDELKQLDEQLIATKNQVDSLTKVKSGNEAQLFVLIMQGKKVTEKTKTLLSEFKSLPRKISYVLDEKLGTAFSGIESFGLVSVYNKPVSASLISEHDCKHTDDHSKCLSYGICVLENGPILMTDYSNHKLKKLDQTFAVTDSCSIKSPFSVCRTRSNEVAVSSPRCVSFVVIEYNLTVKKTIDVGMDCLGIAYSNEELFVANGGYSNKSNNVIKVYNLDGSLLRSLKQINSLANLSISPDGTRIYMACWNDGLIILDREGKIIAVSSDTRLKSVHDICQDDYGNIFVCSHNQNSVLQIDGTGSVVSEILTQSDGIDHPLSVTLAKEPMRLLVTSSKKALQIFKLT